MELKDIANYFGVSKETFKKNMDLNIFDEDIKKEYEIIKNMSLNELMEEYLNLYKKLKTLENDLQHIEDIKEELDDKKEKFKILLHRYEHISEINIEYLKRYGEIKGL